MIETRTVSGRPAQVAYIGAGGEPVEPDQAALIKVLFKDDEGGTTFLAGPKQETTESIVTEYLWAKVRRAAMERLSRAQRFSVVRAQAVSTLTRLRREYDESQHPRDETGKWTDAGGGDTAAGESTTSDAGKAELDPKVTDVGGDEWNRAAAHRLETEFQTARPKIEALEQQAIGASQETPGAGDSEDDEEDAPYVPEEWVSLSDSDQEEAKEKFVDAVYEDYHNSEVDNWQSEQAPDEAKQKVAEDYNSGTAQWASDALDELIAQREEDGPPIPFDSKQLINAIDLQHDGEGSDLEIDFDDTKLSQPAGYDPSQETLPGITPLEPHEMLNEDMRDDIVKTLTAAFDKEAEDVLNSLQPPEYLSDSAKEMAEESWDAKDDDDKFEYVKDATNILDQYEKEVAESGGGSAGFGTLDQLPTTYDPLNETSGEDYRRTQFLARYLSRERAAQILADRNLDVPDDVELQKIDTRLWKEWKSSSTTKEGMLLQVATAEELGGRLNEKTAAEINPQLSREFADRQFSAIGGYAGVKAYVRAKWETTQYLLDKADQDELNLYRGIQLDKDLVTKLFGRKHAEAGRVINDYRVLPTMDVMRNGAASTTTDLAVANGWRRNYPGKVTLRAVVPRTAAVSIPAYGINIKSEREVVVAGTAWKGWDVWQGGAPSLTNTPLQKHAA